MLYSCTGNHPDGDRGRRHLTRPAVAGPCQWICQWMRPELVAIGQYGATSNATRASVSPAQTTRLVTRQHGMNTFAHPLKVAARVRIPLGLPKKAAGQSHLISGFHRFRPRPRPLCMAPPTTHGRANLPDRWCQPALGRQNMPFHVARHRTRSPTCRQSSCSANSRNSSGTCAMSDKATVA